MASQCNDPGMNALFAALVKKIEAKTSVKINFINNVKYEEILEMHSKSRISIALSLSDGLPSSFLESMAMGSFPIQSDTSVANSPVSLNLI